MRRSGLALALSLLLAGPLSAQVRSEVELTRQQIQTERQTLVTAGMQLTEAQAQAFWPVYREYRNELAPLGDRMVELILGYAEQYGSVTDEYAGKMLAEYLDIQKKQLDIRNKYVSQFGKVLPPMLVARFYQIENKLDAVVAYDLAMSIPVLQ